MLLSVVEVREAVLMALGSLRANKLRSGLTILGVMVGVASVIAMASIVDGLNKAAQNDINSLGSNVIYITKFDFNVDEDELSADERNRKPITVAEAKALMERAALIDGVCPQNFYFKPGGNEVKYRSNKASNPQLFGTWPDYLKVRDKSMDKGRFLSQVDEQFRSMNCVLGSDLAKTLFPDEDPIDKVIRVNGRAITVVGVLTETKTTFGDGDDNDAVILPLSTFSKLHPWEEELMLMARAKSYDRIAEAKEEITTILRMERQVPFNKPDNFAMATQDNLKDEVNTITGYIYLAMLVITSVGLMVGGIGVMNIMLVSVTERTREIGVRKAIGARKANIIMQFLTEAMTLSAVGGVIGIVFGALLGIVVNMLIFDLTTVSLFWTVVGFVVSVSVGLVSGIYPAYKAAWLDPIEALRYE